MSMMTARFLIEVQAFGMLFAVSGAAQQQARPSSQARTGPKPASPGSCARKGRTKTYAEILAG